MSLETSPIFQAVDSRARLRKQGHMAAKIYMRNGDYKNAITQIETTVAAYGSYVGLWADLYTCYYCLGNKGQAHSALENLQKEFVLASTQLSEESRLSTQLVLAKGLEDSGEVALAMELLPLEFGPQQGVHLMIQANLLRLKSLLGDRRDLGKLYVQLSQRAFDPSLRRYDQIEIQHALMLADCELIGPKNACTRAVELLKQSDLDSHDRGLIYYDLLETLYLHGATAEVGMEMPAPQTEFESVLKTGSLSAEQESKLSLSERLRLTTCFLSRADNAVESAEWLKKFDLLLESLSMESQNLWRARLQRKRQVTLLINAATGKIHIGDLHIEMKVKSQSFQLLCELAQTPKICLEELALSQGEKEFNEIFQNRVRIAVHRLNRQLGLNHPVAQVSKTHLTLSELVSLITV